MTAMAASLRCEHGKFKGLCPECRPRALARAPERTPIAPGALAFYVYENWLHDRVIVHRGDCSHCNHGNGSHGASSERYGRWHRDFPTRAEALGFALAKSRDARSCEFCATWPDA